MACPWNEPSACVRVDVEIRLEDVDGAGSFSTGMASTRMVAAGSSRMANARSNPRIPKSATRTLSACGRRRDLARNLDTEAVIAEEDVADPRYEDRGLAHC